MSFFKILGGVQQGSSIPLIEHKSYSVTNDYEGDIFLDVKLLEPSKELNFLFDFIIINNNFICERSNLDLYLDKNCEVALENNINYQLPCYIYGADANTVIQICNNNDDIAMINSTDGETQHLNNATLLGNNGNLQSQEEETDDTLDLDKLVTYDDNNQKNEKEIISKNFFTKGKGFILNHAFIVWERIKPPLTNMYLKYKLWVWIVTITCLLIILLLFILNRQLSKIDQPMNITTNSSVDNNVANDMLKLPAKYTGLHLNVSTLTVYGVVESEADILFVTKYFIKNKSKIKLKLVTFDQIKTQLGQLLLPVSGIHIGFNSEVSQVSISGIIGAMSLLDNAEIQINQQLPFVGNMDSSQVFTISDFEFDLNKIINNPTYQSILEVKKDYITGEVIISSYLTSYAKAKLQQELAPIIEKYKGALKFTLNIKDVLKALPFQVTEVYNGDPAYIVTDSGHKVFIGGVESGMTLLNISDTQVTFRGKFVVVVKLSDLLGDVANNQKGVLDKNNSRNQVINDELNKLKIAIDGEKQELKSLQEIYTTTNISNLKQALKQHIDTLVQDIATKEHELGFYSKNT